MITSTVAILFAVGYLLATIWLCRGFRLTARDLCLGGIVCAMTLVLATIRIPLPTGSNITCGSWIPLMLLALLYDYRLSMLSGWVCGILAMILIPGWQASASPAWAMPACSAATSAGRPSAAWRWRWRSAASVM